MAKNIIFFLIGIFYLFSNVASQSIKYCEQFPDSSPIPLPKLPSQFQMHVEATVNGKTIKANEYYDQSEQLGSIVLIEDGYRIQVINDYNQNLGFNIIENTCQTSQLNVSDNSGFFDIHLDNGLETIGTPSEVFHFNNGFGTKYIGQELVRGIPVNHFQSCQYWPIRQASVLIDYYFTVKTYTPPVVLGEFNEIPVMATVVGYAGIDNSGNYRNVSNIYNFFDFRSEVLDRDYAFFPPRGVYCPGTPFTKNFINLKNQTQYTEETILPDGKVIISKIYYDYNVNAVRLDTANNLKLRPPFNQDPVTIIHDFNSGVGYTYDKYTKNCTKFSLGEDLTSFDNDITYTLSQLVLNSGYSIKMRDPYKFLYIDDTYYYAGRRKIRGIDCDAFMSNRTDYIPPSEYKDANYTIFEWCILPRDWYDETSDEAEGGVPIALIIYIPEKNKTITTNIYDFDMAPIPPSTFDISQCYGVREKTEFGISFSYNGINEGTYLGFFKALAEGFFLFPLRSSLTGYNISPLRVIPPQSLTFEDKFVILSGITDYAPPILQFTKFGTSKIDLNFPGLVKAEASSPENCANICINSTRLQNDQFICLSFDYCKKPSGRGGICSFYNASHITNPAIIIESDNECDHYTKNTNSFDSLPRDFAMKQIRNAVVQKQFNISIFDNTLAVIFSFPSIDINDVNIAGFGGNGGFGGFGSGSLREFKPYAIASVYNESSISTNIKLFIRKRSLISVSECARLCTVETAFECESFTYDIKNFDCIWTNVEGDPEVNVATNIYMTPMNTSSSIWYLRDPIYHYIRFPFSVTQELDYKPIKDVETETACAKLCDKETSFSCKSFNYCPSLKQCLLSKNHIHNPDKNPGIIPNPVCIHFSKRSLNDFDLIPQLEIVNLKPASKLYNTSVEICATICDYEESYLCRSFTHYIDSNNCFLYKENLADKLYIDIVTSNNPVANHYSRTYYSQNGVTVSVTASGGKAKNKKYSGGAIFGVLIALIIGFLTLGFLIGYGYSKYRGTNNNSNDLTIKFENPNFKKKEINSKE